MRSRFAQVLGVLLAVLAVGAVASSAAFAATPEWQFEGKAIKTALKVEGIWGATKEQDLKLTDSLLKVVLTCDANSLNEISAKTVETTSAEWPSCKVSSSGECKSESSVTERALGLPWSSELYEESGKLRERVKGSKGKAVGWAFECEGSGKQWENECSASELTAGLSNVSAGVDAAFESLTPKLKCTGQGTGAETGSLEGTELFEEKGLTVTG